MKKQKQNFNLSNIIRELESKEVKEIKIKEKEIYKIKYIPNILYDISN